MRRILLWLGKITDFDRDGVKVILVVAAINLVFIALILWPTVERQVFGPDCDARCEAEAERILNELFPDGLPTPKPFNPEKAISDALRD